MNTEAKSELQRSVGQLLISWKQGDDQAYEKLIPLVYDELRRIARRQMASERSEHTLQTTALVNEAYLRLVKCKQIEWVDQNHFLSLAACLMRRVLVDHARSRGFQKRSNGNVRVYLEDANIPEPLRTNDLIALDDALNSLAEAYPRQSKVVELRFFGGLSVEDTSKVLSLSNATVQRDWAFARAWLSRELRSETRNGSRSRKPN